MATLTQIVNVDGTTIKKTNGQLQVDGQNLSAIPQTAVVDLVSSLNNKQNLIANPTANNLVKQNPQGQDVDSGVFVATNLNTPDNTNLATTGAIVAGYTAADVIVTNNANAFATNVASTAQSNAIATASVDATTKSNAALTSANQYTDSSCETVLNSANQYTDSSCATVQSNAFADATTKADTAQSNAEDYVDQQLESYQTLIANPIANDFLTTNADGQSAMTGIPISLLQNFNGNNQLIKAVGNQLPTSLEGNASQIYIRTSFAPTNSAITINDSSLSALEKAQGQINQANTNLTSFENTTANNLALKADRIALPTLNALISQNASGNLQNTGVTLSTNSTFVGATDGTVTTSNATKTYIQIVISNKQDLKIPATANSIAILDSFGQSQSSNKTISSDTSMSGGSATLNDTGSTKTYIDNQDATKLNLISGGVSGQIISQSSAGQVQTSGKSFVASMTQGSTTNDQSPTALAVDNFVTGIQSALQTNINTKAATTYVDNQDAGLQTQINTKASITYVDGQVATLNAAIDLKADITYVNEQDAALQTNIDAKAPTAYVDSTFIPLSQKGANNGVATLDAGGKLTISQLPIGALIYKGTWNATTNTPTLADNSGTAGDYYIVSVAGTQTFGGQPISFLVNDSIIYNGSIWQKSGNANEVTSVNGQTGPVVLTKSDIGLDNVQDIDTTNAINVSIVDAFVANNAVIAQGQTVQQGLQNAQGQINARIIKIASPTLNNLPSLLADGTLQDSGQSILSILESADATSKAYTDTEIATVQPLASGAVNGNIAIFNNETTVDSLKTFSNIINDSSTNNQIPTALAVQTKISNLAINDITGFDVDTPVVKQSLFYNPSTNNFENRLISITDLPTGISATNIGDGSVSNAEFQYLGGVTSAIQSQINSKANLITPALNQLLSSDGNGAYQATGVQISTDSSLAGGDASVPTNGAVKVYADTGLATKIAKINATTGNLLSAASNGTALQDTGIASSSLVTKTGNQINAIGGSNLTGLSKFQVGLSNVQNIDTTDANNVLIQSLTIANSAIVQSDSSATAFGKAQGQINANVASIASANTSIVTLQGQMTTANSNISTLQGQMTTANNNITSLQNGKLNNTLANGTIFIGNVSGVATAQTLSGDVSLSNSGVSSIANTVVTGKLLTGFAVSNNVIVATDTILVGFNKAQGQIEALKTSILSLALNSLSDVAVSSPVTGQYLYFNGTKFINGALQISGAVNGNFISANGTGALVDSGASVTSILSSANTFTTNAITTAFSLTENNIWVGNGSNQAVAQPIQEAVFTQVLGNYFSPGQGGLVTNQDELGQAIKKIAGNLLQTSATANQILVTGNGGFDMYATAVNIDDVVTKNSTNAVAKNGFLDQTYANAGAGSANLLPTSAVKTIFTVANSYPKLPDATEMTIADGVAPYKYFPYFDFQNDTGGTINVIASDGTTVIGVIPNNVIARCILRNNSTAIGTWDLFQIGLRLN